MEYFADVSGIVADAGITSVVVIKSMIDCNHVDFVVVNGSCNFCFEEFVKAFYF